MQRQIRRANQYAGAAADTDHCSPHGRVGVSWPEMAKWPNGDLKHTPSFGSLFGAAVFYWADSERG